ncbi:hypothetical protein EJ110_NYTH48350 [Nymphaea thermarum]|nr:hypothetical protein EJ110_NYTH48350 [Nymphaea thermarum]
MERPKPNVAGIPLKLVIDRRTKTVVFGEAGKELVDFLFSLLSLPLATIVGLLGTHSVPGSVGQLFDSIEKLDNTFFLTNSPPLSARDRMPFPFGDQQRDVEGFVQGVVTYTISDDLTIAPLSTISTISLMQKLVPLRVPDLAALEERTVTVGRSEEKVNVVRVEPVDTSSSTGV